MGRRIIKYILTLLRIVIVFVLCLMIGKYLNSLVYFGKWFEIMFCILAGLVGNAVIDVIIDDLDYENYKRKILYDGE